MGQGYAWHCALKAQLLQSMNAIGTVRLLNKAHAFRTPNNKLPLLGKQCQKRSAARLKRTHTHTNTLDNAASNSQFRQTRSNSTKVLLRCSNRMIAPWQSTPLRCPVVPLRGTSRTLYRTSRTLALPVVPTPYQSYPCTVPVAPLYRASRTLAPYQSHPCIDQSFQSYPCTVPVVPWHRTSRTIAPYQSYPCIVPVVPLYRTSRTLAPHQSYLCTVAVIVPYQAYPCIVPVVPLYRTTKIDHRPSVCKGLQGMTLKFS